MVILRDRPIFNYQTESNYTVLIVARDSGLVAGQQNREKTFTMTVSIIEVAKVPQILNLPTYVGMREGTPGAGQIYQAKCQDKTGASVTWDYEVLPVSARTFFSVDILTGNISTTVAANFTFLYQPVYYVVMMCGNSELTATATLTVGVVWTTTSAVTTTTTTTTAAAVTVTSSTSSGGGLSGAAIGGIVGGIVGALALAGIAFFVAQKLKSKAAADGLTSNMKQPYTYDDAGYKYRNGYY